MKGIYLKMGMMVLLFVARPFFNYSQDSFTPTKSDKKVLEEYYALINENYKRAKNNLKDNKYSRYFIKYYKSRLETNKLRLANNHYYNTELIDNYFKQILNEIARENSNYDLSGIKVMISRYVFANAFCMGDGTIAVTLGLIEEFESEEELVFILCHEIAHHLLSHTDKKFLDKIERQRNEDFQKQIDNISKSEYYQASKLKEVLKSNLFAERRHSRKYEYEADSLALVLYLNAGFGFQPAVDVMNLLEKLDSTSIDTLNVYHVLNTEPIKPKKSSGFIKKVVDSSVLLADSLVITHPECKQRIAALKEQYKKLSKNENTKNVDSVFFNHLKNKTEKEMFFALLDFEYLNRVLLRSIHLSQNDSESFFANSAIIVTINDLITERKKHRISAVVDKPSKYQSKAAYDLSTFLLKSSYSTFSKVLYAYAKEKFEKSMKDEVTTYNMIKLSHIMNDEEWKNSLSKDFKSYYPKSDFILPN